MDAQAGSRNDTRAAVVRALPRLDDEALAELERESGPRCSWCGEPLRFFESVTHTECGVLQGELPLETTR